MYFDRFDPAKGERLEIMDKDGRVDESLRPEISDDADHLRNADERDEEAAGWRLADAENRSRPKRRWSFGAERGGQQKKARGARQQA